MRRFITLARDDVISIFDAISAWFSRDILF